LVIGVLIVNPANYTSIIFYDKSGVTGDIIIGTYAKFFFSNIIYGIYYDKGI